MSWHLRKKRNTGLAKLPKVKPLRRIKPIAPIGYEYYWRD